MTRRRGPRYLIVGADRFVWSRRHVHERVDGVPAYADCREVVSIRRDGSRGRIEVEFRGGEGRAVGGGPLHAGAVWRADGRVLNLNQPGVVRALLDEVVARGWRADSSGREKVDGWPLFDAVARTDIEVFPPSG